MNVLVLLLSPFYLLFELTSFFIVKVKELLRKVPKAIWEALGIIVIAFLGYAMMVVLFCIGGSYIA